LGVVAFAAVGVPPFTTASAAATVGQAEAPTLVERAMSTGSTATSAESADAAEMAGLLGVGLGGTDAAGAAGMAALTTASPSAIASPSGTASPPAAAPPVASPSPAAAPAATPSTAATGPAADGSPQPSTASGQPETWELVSFAPALAQEFRSYLATRPGAVSVALYDRTTGMTVDVTNSTRTGWEMASTVKLDILTNLLTRTGESGQLPASQLRLARPMISVSDNASASALWRQAGGKSGMNAFFRALGMTSTIASSAWGLTKTTAYDQLRVLKAVSYPGSGLSTNAMATATSLLGTVVASQRWGLTAGVPVGVTVEIKNGWLPYGGGWVINSLAHVHGAGKDYIMAAYTRDSRTMATGVETISGLSRLAWQYVPTVPDPAVQPAP